MSPVDNTYTINVDSLTKFLEEFDEYLTTSQI